MLAKREPLLGPPSIPARTEEAPGLAFDGIEAGYHAARTDEVRLDRRPVREVGGGFDALADSECGVEAILGSLRAHDFVQPVDQLLQFISRNTPEFLPEPLHGESSDLADFYPGTLRQFRTLGASGW